MVQAKIDLPAQVISGIGGALGIKVQQPKRYPGSNA
jgi:hypothetical protein